MPLYIGLGENRQVEGSISFRFFYNMLARTLRGKVDKYIGRMHIYIHIHIPGRYIDKYGEGKARENVELVKSQIQYPVILW